MPKAPRSVLRGKGEAVGDSGTGGRGDTGIFQTRHDLIKLVDGSPGD
jgi:hypothetical protein